MPGFEMIDLTEHLAPVVDPVGIKVVYDNSTFEVISFMEERDDGTYPDFSSDGRTVVSIAKTDNALKYANNVYAKNYYDIKKQMVLAKPSIVLTPDKTTAIGDGSDIITVKVDCKDYLGKSVKWDTLKVKSITGKDDKGNDIPGIAQVSTEILNWDNAATEQTFRVRSFSRGKTVIKVKYFWKEGSPILSDGSPSFPISYGEVELSFTNPGF